MESTIDRAADVLSSSSPPWWGQPRYAVGALVAICAFLIWFLAEVVVGAQNKAQDTLDAQQLGLQRQEQLLETICFIMANGDSVREQWCRAGRR